MNRSLISNLLEATAKCVLNNKVCVCVCVSITKTLPHKYNIESSKSVAREVCVYPSVAVMSLYVPLLALGLSFLDSLDSFSLTLDEA